MISNQSEPIHSLPQPTHIFLALVISAASCLSACSGSTEVSAERVETTDGTASICGTGPGLPPCRAIDGETYQQELDVNTTPGLGSNQQLDEEAETMRNASPSQVNQEVKQLEAENP